MKLFSSATIPALLILGSTLTATAASAEEPGLYSSKNLKIVEQVLPDYPRYKERSGKDGYVVLEFTVAPDGSVAAPAVRDSSSPVFSKAALTAINEWQFEPVMDAGQAVPVRTNMKFSFVPREE